MFDRSSKDIFLESVYPSTKKTFSYMIKVSNPKRGGFMKGFNTMNYSLERAVLSLPEIVRGKWRVEKSSDYSVTLVREKKDKKNELKSEFLVVYASYVLNL